MTTQNIIAAYDLSNDSDRADGMDWYAKAYRLAVTLDPNDPARAAGVIAALSPMNSWPRNVVLAKQVFAGEIPGTLFRNRDKALRIYNGETPLSVLSGPKVISFYLNIMGEDEVTIDRHAIDVALGSVQTDKDRNAAVRRVGSYDAFADEYRRASLIISDEIGIPITPSQLQAIVWVYWRRNVVANFHGDV